MPAIEDRVLLLQLERQYEAIEDRVAKVEKDPDDPEFCDCDCAESDVDMLEEKINNIDRSADTRLVSLEDRVTFLDGFTTAMQARVAELENLLAVLMDRR